MKEKKHKCSLPGCNKEIPQIVVRLYCSNYHRVKACKMRKKEKEAKSGGK